MDGRGGGWGDDRGRRWDFCPGSARLDDFQHKELRMPTLEEVRTVTADGRLVVPWVIQRALGLEHGGPVRFQVENGVVTLVAVEAKPAEAPVDAACTERNQAVVRAQLVAELKTLMEVADRDRALAEAAD
jgi:bifunctional DNA-binding transcriptional regulator/antitoxin component of YhaV-PrlF toxin-antitoxin module